MPDNEPYDEIARRVRARLHNEGLLRVLATDVVTGEQFDPADIRTVEPDDFA